MKRILIAVSVALTVAGAALFLAANRATDASAAPPAKTSTAGNATLPAGKNATEVYEALTLEIQAISKKIMEAPAPEQQVRYYADIEAKLTAFRARWPNTPECNDAAFQLGAMNYGVQKYDQAVKYINEYLGKSGADEHQQQGFAHYYLAESYKGQGKYDLAEAEYKIVLAKYSDAHQQLTAAAQNSLASLPAERKLAIGGEPVGFSVKSTDGKVLSPAAYKGKVLLIDFWATWCGPCVAEMPNVKQVYAKYHPQGFEIVGISLDQSRDRLDQYIKKNAIAWPQYYDGKWWNNDVAVKYGVKSIPTTILVDKSGKIRYKSLRGKQLENAVAQLLTEKS